MAKRNNRIKLSQVQRKRFGHDIESLGLTPDKRSLEVRFDVDDPDVRRRIQTLSRYGLVSVRQHGAGEKIWRVSLTHDGTSVAEEHYRRVERTRARSESEGRALSHEELQARKTERDQEFAARQQQHSKGGIEQVALPPDPIFITTQTLRAFQIRATEKGMSRVLSKEALDSLDLNYRHRVLTAWKHTSDDGRHRNMRLALRIGVKPTLEVGTKPTEKEIICDIALKDWDMLMVPHKYRERQIAAMPGAANTLYLAAPTWTATRSYDVVHNVHSFYHGHVAAYERTGWHGPFSVPDRFGRYRNGNDEANAKTLHGDEAIDFITHPRSLMNADLTNYLTDAHPLVIDPEWVEMQEDWTSNEAWAYAQRVVLPYDPLYLDFEGQGGRLPEVEVWDGIRVGMSGCLIYTDRKSGRLAIQPVGGRQVLDPVLKTDVLAGGYPYEQIGRVLIGGRCDYGEPFPVSINDTQLADIAGLYVTPYGFETLATNGVAVDLPTYREAFAAGEDPDTAYPKDILPPDLDPDTTPGYIELPLAPEDALHVVDDLRGDIHDPPNVWFSIFSRATIYLAIKAMSMMSLIDNENVELREAELARAERRAVERDRKKGRDHGVASEIVVVRKTRYVSGKKVEDEATIEYSHQWRVRRHEQHHGPHTRTYQAKPWLAKPCGRCGSCRRFIIESYIKGPADKPLKDKKTYVFKGEDDDC